MTCDNLGQSTPQIANAIDITCAYVFYSIDVSRGNNTVSVIFL